jgi:hypothetical protein
MGFEAGGPNGLVYFFFHFPLPAAPPGFTAGGAWLLFFENKN